MVLYKRSVVACFCLIYKLKALDCLRVSDKTTRPTLIAYGYNIGCTHINYKREPFVAYYPILDENGPDFQFVGNIA